MACFSHSSLATTPVRLLAEVLIGGLRVLGIARPDAKACAPALAEVHGGTHPQAHALAIPVRGVGSSVPLVPQTNVCERVDPAQEPGRCSRARRSGNRCRAPIPLLIPPRGQLASLGP